MPRYAQGPELPAAMARLADALGANQARLAIINFLRTRPGADRSAITAALGIGHQTVYSHLQALEASGLVSTDIDASGRHGRTVHYWLDLPALQGALRELLAELDATPSQ